MTLTVIKPEEDRNVFVNEPFQRGNEERTQQPSGHADGWNWHYVDGVRLDEMWSDGSEGTRHMYAQAYYGNDVPWAVEDFNWEEFNWGNWTEAFEDKWKASATSLKLPLIGGARWIPELQVLYDNIPVGGFVEIKVLEPQEGAWYHGGIGSRNGDGDPDIYYEQFDMDDDHIIRIPVRREVEPGEHAVMVECGGLTGQEGNRSHADITVIAGERDITLSKYNIELNEPFHYSIYAPGAKEILVTWDEEPGWETGDWDHVWQLGRWDGDYASV